MALHGAAAAPTLRWKFCTNGSVLASPTIVPGPVGHTAAVVFGSVDNSVYQLDAASGALRWRAQLGDTIVGAAAVTPDGATVFVGSSDTFLHALDGRTGASLWNASTGTTVPGSPADTSNVVWSTPVLSTMPGPGAVYFGAYTGKVYSVDAATGAQHWNFSATWAVHSGVLLLEAGGGAEPPAVVFGSLDYCVYAVRAGALLWKASLGDMVLGTPVSDGSGTIFVGSSDKRLYALNGTTGDQLWNVSTGGGIEGPATVSGGLLYVGSNDGKLYCIEVSIGLSRIVAL